jgi:hypothetical protein
MSKDELNQPQYYSYKQLEFVGDKFEKNPRWSEVHDEAKP